MMTLIRGARVRTIRLSRVALAFAASATLAGPALAQDDAPTAPSPGEVVAHCFEHMGAIASATSDAMREQTAGGVGTIASLAQNGARPRLILHAGETTKNRCARIAGAGQEALDDALARCAGALRQLDAPPAAFDAIREARRRTGLAIGDALTHCKRHINHALDRALGESEPDEPATVSLSAGAALLE